MRFGLEDNPRSIDPRFADDAVSLLVVDALFDSLTSHGRNQFPVPSIASAWEPSEDLRTWTFTIDPEATFHDGSSVTAADFVRAFQRITDGTARPVSFQAHLLRDVVGFDAAQAEGVPLAGVTVDDEARLVVELVRPDADFASVVAHPSLAPVPASADEDPRWGESPVGNGPFAMVEPWAHNQFIRLASVDASTQLDEVLFRIYADDPDNAQQYRDFQAGQLHVALVPPGELAGALQRFGSAGTGESRPGVLDGPAATTYHYGFDTTRPPFDRVEVRRAVSLLLDRSAIASQVMRDTRDPADALLPAGLVGHEPGTCTWCAFDPPQARQLLEDAGIVLDAEEVGPIVLLHNEGASHAEIARRIAEAIQQELGLQVEVRSLRLREFTQALHTGEGHLFRLGWTSEHPLPSSFLVAQFHSRHVGSDNVTGFADDEVDALLDEAQATAARRERLVLASQAEARILDLMPTMPLLTYRLHRVVATDVRGFRMDALGRVDLTRVSLVDPA